MRSEATVDTIWNPVPLPQSPKNVKPVQND